MRIGFCHLKASSDRRAWSGIPYFMFQAMQKHCGAEIVDMGPIPTRFTIPHNVVRRLSLRVTGREYLYTFSPSVTAVYAKRLRRKILQNDLDILYFPATCNILSALETDIPCIYMSDATFRLMVNYYPEFSRLWESTRRAGEFAEQRAIDRSQALIFASDWAAESAISDYKAPRERVSVLPFGANLEKPPSYDDVRSGIDRNRETWSLLFVGASWVRKGGSIAVETVAELNRRGVQSQLTIVGESPPKEVLSDTVRYVGFLNKSNPDEMAELERLYREADVFIMPTRSEAAGVVFSEASAFGLPILATATGGVGTYVEDGQTGYLLDATAAPASYADKIESIAENPDEYRRLARNARAKYEQQLNWDAWGVHLREIVRSIV